MPTIASVRRKFLGTYRAQFSDFKVKAEALEKFVRSILQETSLEIHAITARAKEPDSVHLKLLRKKYRRPQSQLTDKIGARVITYYADDVDLVIDALRPHIDIDRAKSVDKRRDLGLRSFGYSSVHIVGQLKPSESKKSTYACLDEVRFEIQVRSILEHAWAEFEHEIVFKSGIDHPDSVVRRFAELAGTLELVNSHFASLRQERAAGIEESAKRYKAGFDNGRPFDAVRLLGFLEMEYPRNPSWRQAQQIGKPFPPRIETACVAALKSCGLGTARSLQLLLRRSAYRRALKSFAAAESMKVEDISHLALVAIAIGLRSERVLRDYFPGMAENPGMLAVLKR